MKKAILLLATCFALVGCGVEGYSEGDRFGVVNKLSQKGVFCKSWEGELNLGGAQGANDGGGMVPNIWRFSVRPSDASRVVADLQTAAASGKRVRVHYSQALLEPVCETDTNYFVKSVEILK